MTRLVRTELLKQRTTRTCVAGVAAAPVVTGLVTVAVLGGAGKEGNPPLRDETLVQVLGAPHSVVTFIALVLGLLAMTGEHRHGTITTTFLATPRRRDVVVAKLAASSLVGGTIGLLSLAASAAVAVPWLRNAEVAVHLDADTLRVAVGLVASTTLYGALGVSIGAVIRNQTAAATVVLVWLLAVEGMIGDIFSRSPIVHWLPAAAGRAIVHAGPAGDGPSPGAAAATFASYVLLLAAGATHSTLRRDVT